MAFSPASHHSYSGSSSNKRAASTVHQVSRLTDPSSKNLQLLGDYDSNAEHHRATNALLTASVPLGKPHQFNTGPSSTFCIDRDSSTQATTSTSRHPSPYCAYLSPGYSSVHSPSMASDGTYEHSQNSTNIWIMMTPTRDAEGNTTQGKATPASERELRNAEQDIVLEYDLSVPESLRGTWPTQPQDVHQAGQMDFDLTGEQATSGGVNMPPQHTESVPLEYFTFPTLSSLSEAMPTNNAYDSANCFTDGSTPIGLPPYEQHEPVFEASVRPSRETYTNTAPKGPHMQCEGGSMLSSLPSATERFPMTCKSCKTTFASIAEEEVHDRDCDRLPCLFHFAGCRSKFKGWNEWKRHVRTLHLVSKPYLCPMCPKEFNRKDLFKHHYIRMHCSRAEREAHANKTTSPALKEKLEKMQTQAGRGRGEHRLPPQAHKCFIPGCPKAFHERDSWDKCLEHVCKHHGDSMKGTQAIRAYNFTDEQLSYFEMIGALVYENGQWILGAQSNGERARRNKKKAMRR